MTPDRWQKIETIFQAAIELSPGRRKKYLLEACGSDESLFKEVSDLLANDESADSFIENPVWTDSNFLNSKAKKVISDSLKEQTTGPTTTEYIGRQIGFTGSWARLAGGMGAVFPPSGPMASFLKRSLSS
jgi:hypothetical protein